MIRYQFGPQTRFGGARFRLWAPGLSGVAVEIDGRSPVALHPAGHGWWEVEVACDPGARYRFRLPDGAVVPDPASRYQPGGVHGPSVLTTTDAYRWRATGWRGRPWRDAVIYEAHAGLMGGFRGVAAQLPALADLGITAVQLMPIGEFSGQRNWGYDGVLPFAPESAYGTPDDLKFLVDEAHQLGLMMFLDVVYNHFGPDGNYLALSAPEFFRTDIKTPWGAAIDFRRPEVRRFFTENALYWLDEFRFDGLRLDAVHAISEPDWVGEMAAEARAAFPDRRIHLVLENEHNDADLLRSVADAQWNDDFHNVMHVLLTGETHAYYADFAERPIDLLARALAEGFIYQGQPSPHHDGRPRGTSTAGLPPTAFVNFLQNHDQIGNRALGERLVRLADQPALDAAIALLLLCPQIPLIFMGEESGADEPFLFFTDFHDSLADAVREGRRKEFAHSPGFGDFASRAAIPDPNAFTTFQASRIARDGRNAAQWRSLYRDLLALRAELIAPGLDGATALGARPVGDKAVIARWRLGYAAILTLACNFGDAAVHGDFPAGAPVWGDRIDGALPAATTIAWVKAA